MAPDKIYFNNHTARFNHEKRNVDDTCYLRKDALLKWAKEKADDYKQTANIRRSFEMIIRKIESL